MGMLAPFRPPRQAEIMGMLAPFRPHVRQKGRKVQQPHRDALLKATNIAFAATVHYRLRADTRIARIFCGLSE